MVPTKTLIVFAAFAAVALAGVTSRHSGSTGDISSIAKSGVRHHHEPSFMEGLDEVTKGKFKAIFHDHSMKEDAKDTALLNLATSVLTPEKLAEFKAAQADLKQRRAQWKADYDAKYAKLSPKAKKAADQLKSIWEDTKMDFVDKKEKSDEVMKTLTVGERQEIANLMPHHGGPHFTPKFMRNLTQEVQSKFVAIFHDNSLKPEAKDAALTKLAESTLTPEQLAEFKAHLTKMIKWRKEMDERIAKLSPNARKAADAIHAVFQNHDMSWDEKKQQIDAIKAGLTDSVKAELEALRPHRHGDTATKDSESQQ